MESITRSNGSGATPEPIDGNRGASILGPRNVPVETENPSLLASPSTDSGTVPNLKFPFAAARNRILTGGWAREVTMRELPVAKELAGVNMRLKPGGIRELHWHKEAEWSYMIAGRARLTAVDSEGRNFIDDVGAGDLWYFPAGIPHSIQGLADGCEFLLVFDDGAFSENETFLISDWFAHTPRDVLAKNFGVPESAFANIPLDYEHDRYLFDGEVPPPLPQDIVSAPNGSVPQPFTHRMPAQEPIRVEGGQVRIADSANFPVAKTVAAALVEIEPGGLRELHWHPNTDEWQYYISGRGRMTVFASGGKARTFDYQAGDVGYVPFAMGHYVQNTGDETLTFLEMFRSDRFADVSLNQWLALTPPELVQAHLNLDRETVAALSKNKPIIVRPRAEPAQREVLPEWPATAVAVLSTIDGGPHAIPVSAPVRGGDRRILFSLVRSRDSLARLRAKQQVALAVLAGDTAFTVRGRARIVEEPMARAPEFAAIEIDVQEIDHHRGPAVELDLGLGLPAAAALRDRIDALRALAAARPPGA